jgi:dTDP-glucose pyrophosphorylase/mRNA-degrading endonuclease RelE of RelBE toxin-antitoxin system
MTNHKDHIIFSGRKIKEALLLLNKLSQDAILFVIDKKERLLGTISDGDVRRGLLKGFTLENLIDEIIQKNSKYITKGENNLQKVIEYREGDFKIIPVVDGNKKVINIINFRKIKSYLPLDAIIMAGGRGQRLKPLTDKTPKPLLQVGGKAIIEHNLDRLILYGINDFWLSVNYLGEQIENHFGDGNNKKIKIKYVWEKKPLGTIGAVSKISNFQHDYILITNSDLLTNIDYEQFFLEFINQKADLALISIPYHVTIPYAILETDNGNIKSLKEKPIYTYYSNGGVYILKKELLKYIPKDTFFNATDLIEKLIREQLKVISLPFSGYWLDIGKHEDFEKAQSDIKNIKFE